MPSWSSPECLLSTDNYTFVLHEDVASKIQQVKKRLVIVCVSGPLRAGKSTLMNRLVKYLSRSKLPTDEKSGFGVNEAQNSFTKGFWVWYIDHPDDEDKGVLIIDVEGMEDLRAPDGYDNCLLCLSILVSSVFVYNVNCQTLNLTLFNKLSFVKISEHIQQQASGDVFPADDQFPVLVIALRNTSLINTTGSSEAYLEKKLRQMCMKPNSEKKLKSKSKKSNTFKSYLKSEEEKVLSQEAEQIDGAVGGVGVGWTAGDEENKKLTDYFVRRKLFFFPFPVDECENCHQTHLLSDEKLNPAFVQQSDNFCKYIADAFGPVKTLLRKPIDGQIFIDLLRNYVNYMEENDSSSNFGFGVNMIIERENNSTVAKTLSLYREKMEERLTKPLAFDQLELVHLTCHEIALKWFKKNVYLDGRTEYLQKLKMELEVAHSSFVTDNMKKSCEYCRREIESLTESMLSSLKQQDQLYFCSGGYGKLTTTLENIKLCYDAKPDKGIMAEAEWNDFMVREMNVYLKYVLTYDSVLTDRERLIKETEMEVEKTERENNLHKQAEKWREKYEETVQTGGSTQNAFVERAYEEKISNTRDFYDRQIDDLKAEKVRLAAQGRFEEVEFIDEEIFDLKEKKRSVMDKLKSFLQTLRGMIEAVAPFIHLGLMLAIEIMKHQ